MDKRTFFFVLAMTFALFATNIYFEREHQEAVQAWKEKQEIKEVGSKATLEQEINQNTLSTEQLPIYDIYADAEGEKFLTTAIHSQNTLYTLAWNQHTPQEIFARPKGSNDKPESYHIAFLPQHPKELTVYQLETTKISFEKPSEFGTQFVHLFIPATNQKESSVVLGRLTDGHFIIPAEKLKKLDPSYNSFESSNAVLFSYKNKELQPVGFYNSNTHAVTFLNEISGMSNFIKQQAVKQKNETTSETTEEQFYVLQTPYQQLVFSNYGGALAEVNLPFKDKDDTESVVREIEFDRDMVQHHPDNAYFPAHAYFTPSIEGKDPEKHEKGQLGGFYPLLRRDLIQEDSKKSIRVSPRFYGLNLVSEFPEVSEQVYEVTHFDHKRIVFESTTPHRKVIKTFTLEQDNKEAPYVLHLTMQIEGDSRGLWLSSGVPEVEWISGGPAPALKYRSTRNQKAVVDNIDLPQDSITMTSVFPDWICNSNGFLGFILDPTTKTDPGYRAIKVSGQVVPSRLLEIGKDIGRFKAQDLPGYMTMLPIKSTAGTSTFRIFAGPFSGQILKTVDRIYSNPETNYNPDYIACQSFHGWFAFISEPFAKFLFILMDFFHSVTGSWALSIFLLTVALRIMMYPLNAWSTKSMIRMQEIAPQMAAIQEKYKKDPKKSQMEILNLYREKNINPLSGCLPMLIQMPFLIGMFDLLKSTFELRGASFIPGWIDDLTAPDVLFTWKTPIFFIGNEFHLLPILLGVVMFAQQRLMSTAPKDPSLMTDQQRQQRAMGTIMSVVFAIMFYHFPSGLNIYWLSSMLLGILQQWWTTKKMQASKVAKLEKV